MKPFIRQFRLPTTMLLAAFVLTVAAQEAAPPPDFGGGPPPPFGPGGPNQQKTKLLKKFDADGDKVLNAVERAAALEFLNKEQSEGRGRRGPGGPPGFGRPGFPGRGANEDPAKPGARLSPSDVKSYPDAGLYDPNILRTIFIEFEDVNWEKELAAFKNTDVDVPAKLIVDGKTYPAVGVHFRGMSSFMMVGEGRKRSLNLSLDFLDEKQNLDGFRTLNLLNSHEDPSFLRTVLYSEVAREYLAIPKANHVRVVINGESWGVYVNLEQFNKDFAKEWFGSSKGARWHVAGSPNGRGSLAYLGDDPEAYKKIYSIKSKDTPHSWSALIKLCKTLNETPPDQLERALAPLLDVEGALRFLALENALINNDGYWIRTSDYNLLLDDKGVFHVVPHDFNETFSQPGGPGFGGGPGGPGGPGRFGPPGAEGDRRPPGAPGEGRPSGGPLFGGGPKVKGVELDPLFAAGDASKPLISKLLAVPALKARYLGHVRGIAEKWLDWNKLGPIAQKHHDLIAVDVAADTRKLDSTEDFSKSLAEDIPSAGPGPGVVIGLKSFAEQRRAYLMKTIPAAR